MQILYGCANCSNALFDKIFEGKKITVSIAIQKYHSLLMEGFSQNDVKVKCISSLPINNSVTSKKWISYPDEVEGNVRFHYYKTINFPLVRQLMIFFGAFFNTLKTKKAKETIAMCDCLNVASSFGMLFGCKLRRIPLVTIVTDLPILCEEMQGGGITRKISTKFFDLVDGFVLLTKQMNDKINKKNKPFIVLEGHCDALTLSPESIEKTETKTGEQVVLYAGSIQKLYGIKNLTEGFLKANLPNATLMVYGDGDYREELEEIAKEHKNVKYMGVRPNAEIVKNEMASALLVNPRPSAPEYTKYSFPSKNMEYMVSGTPTLTTVLPGMPEEYYPYVYLLHDETSEGVKIALTEILSLPQSEREQKALNARQFVLKEKSNIRQSQKIIELYETSY